MLRNHRWIPTKYNITIISLVTHAYIGKGLEYTRTVVNSGAICVGLGKRKLHCVDLPEDNDEMNKTEVNDFGR